MPWQCRMFPIVGTRMVEVNPPRGTLVGTTLLVDSSGHGWDIDDLPIGAMFAVPRHADREDEWPWWAAADEWLSDYYHAHNAHREPLLVKLPGRVVWCIDSKSWSGNVLGAGWAVTGNGPNITVSPSINCIGTYHGFLVNGVISDDCEGRQYHHDGRLIRPDEVAIAVPDCVTLCL